MRVESSASPVIESPTTAAAAPPTAAPSAAAAPALDEDRVDAPATGTAGVWAHRTVAADRSAAAASPMLSELADAMVRDGSAGLEIYLEGHPGAARELATGSREGIEATLRATVEERRGGDMMARATAYLDVDVALDRYQAALESDVRETVRGTAVAVIDQQLAALDHLNADDVVAALRGAPAGSALASAAQAIGVWGDALDATRVRSALRDARQGLTEIRDTLAGQTWSPEELPGTARRVMDAMGLSGASPESMAAAAFHRPHWEAATVAHTGVVLAEVGHLAVELIEVPHLVTAGAAGLVEAGAAGAGGGALVVGGASVAAGIGLPLAIGVTGIVLGAAIHHQIEENRADRTELARGLGL